MRINDRGIWGLLASEETKPEIFSEIFWPCPEGGRKSFPVGHHFWTNHNTKTSNGNYCSHFFESVEVATNRIWVIDKFFLGDEERGVDYNALDFFCMSLENSAVASIRILASSGQPTVLAKAKDKISRARNLAKSGRNVAAEIEVKGHLKSKAQDGIRLIHDRFAIVDDELWHFGSTVGGVHPSLSAVTGPWSAQDTLAEDFFIHIWK